jgi:molybdopterin biosynthesis enzyme
MNLDTLWNRRPAKMIAPEEALRLVLGERLTRSTRNVPLDEACGMQLAESIEADRDYPPFPRAMMDGYAVALADAGRTIGVAGEVAAGQEAPGPVGEGRFRVGLKWTWVYGRRFFTFWPVGTRAGPDYER